MTSGQEGGQPPYGQAPQDQPPHGQAPQGPPPYGQPPQAPPPYGYPPYGGPGHGYQPAPVAPTGWGPDAPRPVERPITVRAGLGAYIAAIVLSVVANVVTLLNWREFVSYIEAQTQLNSAQAPFDAEQAAALGLRIGIAFQVIFVALYLLFLWFAWKGHNWARIVLWVLGGLGVVFGLAGLSTGSAAGPFPFVTALGWFQLLFTAVGIVLLALKPSNDWYRYRRWLRVTGQSG